MTGFTRRFALLLALVLVSGSVSTQVTAESTSVKVHAAIQPYLNVSAVQSVGSYQVTASDIHNGHIDLPQALFLSYETNISEAILFEVASPGPEQVMIDGKVGAVQVAAALPGQRVSRNLDLRLLLPARIEEGIYPLRISLVPVAY